MASAVLHFARDAAHFEAMLRQMWRVLRPGGLFFARLASTIGIEPASVGSPLGERATTACRTAPIDSWSTPPRSSRGPRALGGTLLDPIKTTVVHEPAFDDDVGRRADAIE